jgi:hypothetical protein
MNVINDLDQEISDAVNHKTYEVFLSLINKIERNIQENYLNDFASLKKIQNQLTHLYIIHHKIRKNHEKYLDEKLWDINYDGELTAETINAAESQGATKGTIS